MNELSLKNPRWAKMIVTLAQEYKNKGRISEFIEVNGFNSDTITYIQKHI